MFTTKITCNKCRHIGVECLISAWKNIHHHKPQNVYHLVCKFSLLHPGKRKLLLQGDKTDLTLICQENNNNNKKMHFTQRMLRSQSHTFQN